MATSTLQRGPSHGLNASARLGPARASSQKSIHDYPEHLNPFHEDDNHKRIRFWGMTSGNAKKTGRSNSFSLNGIKEMWAFKSFRLKKRSSTLGINKTSESPPTLRRQHQLVHPADNHGANGNGNATMRHTVNVGYQQTPAINDRFTRGAVYRSSLQNVNTNSNGTPSDISFLRNDRYRSTIQNGYHTTPSPRHHVSERGSVTPVPSRGHHIMQHGVSQSSLNSTNPFDGDTDADFDDDTVSRSTIGSMADVSTGGERRRHYRKKRRAPPPPPPRSSSDPNYTPQTEAIITTVPETSREASTEDEKDLAEISNLAAQIASFVQNADSDTDRSIAKPTNTSTSQPVVTETTTATNTSAPSTSSPSSKTAAETVHHVQVHTVSTSVHHRQTTPDRFDAVSSSRSSSANSRVSPENNEAYPVRTSRTPDRANSTSPVSVDGSTKVIEKQINTLERSAPPKIVVREATQEEEQLDRHQQSVVAHAENVQTRVISNTVSDSEIIAVPTVAIVRTISGPEVRQVESLKITESAEDLPLKTEPVAITSSERDRYKIRFVALKPAAADNTISEPTIGIQPNSSWLHTTISVIANGNDDENHDYDNVVVRSNKASIPSAPPKRRRSVKDIIASINKSQSLLRINQDPNAASLAMDQRVSSLAQFDPAPAVQLPNTTENSISNESIVRNLTQLQASEQQIRQTICEMERTQNDANNNHHHNLNRLDEEIDHIPVMAERFSEFSDEFKKCNVNGRASASSPLLVQRRDKGAASRTDWNPLPKPRRSRHLTQEAVEIATNTTAKSDLRKTP